MTAARNRSREIALHAAFWVVGLGFAAREAWTNRFDVYSDGLAYLDVGDALWRGDWSNGLSGYWSPLYAALTGGAIRLFKPSPEWEGAVVHAVNVACFAAAMAGFAFLLTELLDLRRREAARGGEASRGLASDAVVIAVGYVVFLWAALDLIGVARVNPDMCVAACFFFASALLARQAREGAGSAVSLAFGAVLGLGYLSKSVMFPMAFVFLGVSFFAARRHGQPVRRLALALAAFLLVSAPFAVALSRAKGRLTFGDSGKLAYAWFASVVPQPPIDWLGQPPGTGTPLHPRRRIFESPAVYEFGSPIRGTYAYWQEPSYWMEGLEVPFDPGQQLKAIRMNARDYAHLVLSVPAADMPVVDRTILVGLAMLLAARGWKAVRRQEWRAYAPLLAPPVAMLGLYLVVHVEPRYVAAPLATLYALLFTVLSSGLDAAGLRVAICAAVVIVGSWLIPALYPLFAHPSRTAARESAAPAGAASTWTRWDKMDSVGRKWQLKVAARLRELGLRPGDRIGFIGFLSRFYWARLAQLRIVAEIRQPLPDELYWFAPAAQRYSPDVERFWSASPEVHDRVYRAFASAGASAIVTDEVPRSAGSGWIPLGDTGFGVWMLDRSPAVEVPAR